MSLFPKVNYFFLNVIFFYMMALERGEKQTQRARNLGEGRQREETPKLTTRTEPTPKAIVSFYYFEVQF